MKLILTNLEKQNYSLILLSNHEDVAGYIDIIIPTIPPLKASKHYLSWWGKECKNKPFVSYVWVDQKRKGYGIKLYKAAIAWLDFAFQLPL